MTGGTLQNTRPPAVPADQAAIQACSSPVLLFAQCSGARALGCARAHSGEAKVTCTGSGSF